MLRVTCQCGKTLGVEDAFAGKQVRCPACLNVINVPGAVAPQRPPTPAAPAQKPSAPAPAPTKTPLAPAPAPAPANRRRKPPLVLLGVLFGGVAVALLVLAGVAIAVIVWLNSGPKPLGSPGNPVAVKFHVPAKVGDQREVAVTLDFSFQEESKSDSGNATKSKNEKATFAATIRTLGVDKDGRETRREIEIDKFLVTPHNSQEKEALPKGAVLFLEGSGPKAVPRLKDGGAVPPLVLQWFPEVQTIAFEAREPTEDQLFGTTEKQSVGATWPVSKAEFVKWAKPLMLNIGADDVSGTGKLVAVAKEGEKSYLDFEAVTTVSLDGILAKENPGGGDKGKATITWTARYPADYATGSLKRALKVEIKLHTQAKSDDKRPAKTTDVSVVQNYTQEVRYLPPAKIPKTQNPGKAGIVLKAAKVKRGLVGNDVHVSFHYDLPRDVPAPKWYAVVEFKGQAAPTELPPRDAVNMENAGEWSGQVTPTESPAAGTPFTLYVSDEPLTGPDQRRQASQVQGVVE